MVCDIFRMGEQNSGAAMKKYSGDCLDTDTSISADSNAQRPSANKISATQNFMSFETMQFDNYKNFLFKPLSSNGLQHIPSDDTFESTQKACSAQVARTFLAHDVKQFALHAYQNQALYNKIPLEGPFTNKIFTQRANEQLTIFYAGSVHVFDNLPLVTVQTIILMAIKASNAPITAVNQNSGFSVLPSLKGLVSNGQFLTQALNNTSHIAHSRPDISASCNRVIISPSPSHNELSKNVNSFMKANTAQTSISRVMPQARKASLARFLEKRKERLRNKLSHLYEKKPSENSISLEVATLSSQISSEADISISSNQGNS